MHIICTGGKRRSNGIFYCDDKVSKLFNIPLTPRCRFGNRHVPLSKLNRYRLLIKKYEI